VSDFWTRKKEELQQDGTLPTPRPSVMATDRPWWAEGTKILPEDRNTPQRPSEPRTGRTDEAACPHCRSGNYMKPSSSISARCFDCGYTSGRQLNELELPGIASPEAATLKVKQIQSGGHFGRSTAEIAQNNAALEQSAQGRAKLN